MASDLHALRYRHAHPCWQWNNADICEYIDVSDWHALLAPRPLIVETGMRSENTSQRIPAFVSDRQLARRSRSAYSDAPQCYIPYLHDGGHVYRFGEISIDGAAIAGVRVPALSSADDLGSLEAQVDPTTLLIKPSLLACIYDLLGTPHKRIDRKL
jgi:hypothetical protein